MKEREIKNMRGYFITFGSLILLMAWKILGLNSLITSLLISFLLSLIIESYEAYREAHEI